MTKKTTFLFALMLVLGHVFAQKPTTKFGLKEGPKLQNVAYGEYNSPKAVQKVFAYDNHSIGSGLGSSSAHQMGMCIELPASGLTDYVGQSIDYIRFGITDKSKITDISLQIIENSITSIPVYTQTIKKTNLVKGWNLLKLDTAYSIPSETNVFIAIQVTNSDGAYSLAMDTDAANQPEYSGYIFLDNEYYKTLAEIGRDKDFCLEAFITDGGGTQLSDLTITNVAFTTDDCVMSTEEVIKVTLKNIGDTKIDNIFNLQVEVDGKTLLQSISPTAFVTGAEMVIDMPAADLSAFKRYKATASVDYADNLSNNNKLTAYRSTGDAIIQVDLKTDAYPEETTWEILDEAGNIWATNGALEAETRHIENICVAGSNCYVFKIYDAYGDGIAGYNSPAGTFVVRFNGEIRGTCPSGGDFGSEYLVYGLGNGCPENDMVVTSVNIPKFAAPGTQEIAGTIFNYGKETLSSFEVTYQIGDYTSPIYYVEDAFIKTGITYSFTHDVPFNFNTNGKYSVIINVTLPNGVEDENPADNSMTKEITISDMQPKKQLFEHFTSSTCAPCAAYTPTADVLLAKNEGEYSLIRYQVNWPGSGDPYYIPDVRTRVNYYGVSGVPSVYRNGTYDMSVSQSDFDDYAAQPTPIGLDVFASYDTNNMVYVALDISSLTDIPAGFTAHIAVVEKVTTENATTNGETEFHNVLMKMLPDANGTTLDALTAGQEINISESYDMSTTNVEEISDLRVVAFIQDEETMEIMQSEMVDVVLGSTVNLTFNLDMSDMVLESGAKLYVAGSFNDWATSQIELTDADNNGIYTATVAVGGNMTYEYNYYLNTTVESENKRTVEVADADKTVNDVWSSNTDVELAVVKVYPNPFNQTLSFVNMQNITNVVIADALGQLVMQYTVTEDQLSVATQNMANGVYFVTITDNKNNQRIMKVVKQ